MKDFIFIDPNTTNAIINEKGRKVVIEHRKVKTRIFPSRYKNWIILEPGMIHAPASHAQKIIKKIQIREDELGVRAIKYTI